ncbi:alpha-L-arabinofuranosidase [Actinoplanes sp. SE50]|uniref:arabinofuranosidase catalytic domain-containing protein n=1 Tax=unclassified Actinoplanes TaxID=2626549 RepID=UPI00023EC5D8|nr:MULTISPECIES: arabinofuranosidase catalytic domain-containing protein [unclassified Actinoplanes]AEV83634.1 alpha-L-arabinofuranosidase B catalytic [Actinoplanes sp. SE50/110]ATO82222.1 alpha-L-arabinofuranosidase [Actinoplanes sp. SE50]SLL99629.1 alpha-L-arabinofuranosidase [Actinoplanes sp. SE50/110]
MRRKRSLGLLVAAAVSLVAGLLAAPGPAIAAASLPCDLYAAAGTPCVAAHSVTRALFGAYSGRLYQVTRASDGATHDIGTLAAGGYADAADQDAFCNGTTCRVTHIWDQTSRHNDLQIAPDGGAGSGDRGADASEIAVTAGGHKVYGIWVSPGVGYRYNGVASGVAVNGQPEGVYMVASGTHVGSDCCFDYGNAESTPYDTGNGHMDAVSIATTCYFAPCQGSGPWIEADMENGMFQGGNGANPNPGNNSAFVTAVLKNNGQTTYALKGGNSQSGGLTTWFNGGLPTDKQGYRPMHQEGGIILGIGGDNSNRNRGTWFEGAMVAGYPTDAAENAVQANVVGVGYAGQTTIPNGPAGTVTGPGGKCTDVSADDTGANGAAVQIWDCQSFSEDQRWTHFADNSLRTLNRCLDATGNGTANGTPLQLWDCNGGGAQKFVQQADGSLRNPQSGRCVDSPNGTTANGTRLQLWDCNGAAAQKFAVNAGGVVGTPGGKCTDVGGDDTGGNGTAVQIWDCQSYAVDQHWFHQSNGALRTLGRCLDINGNGTANGTPVELWDCNGVGGQVWQQQADGSLRNPQSGRCLDAPNGTTANGTRLQIWDCNGSAAQKFTLS